MWYVKKTKGSANQMRTTAFKPGYPENVYCAVFGVLEHPNMPPDAEETLEYVMGTLPQLEAEMFMMNYRDDMSIEAISKKCGVAKERVRYIIHKAMRKVRHRSRSEILIVGREAYLNLVVAAKEEEKIRYYQRISELEALIQKQVGAQNAARLGPAL